MRPAAPCLSSSAYMPYRIADDYVASGALSFVKDAPIFPYPAYAVWVASKNSSTVEAALIHLRYAAEHAPWIELEA